MDMLRTSRTYATRENALKALAKAYCPARVDGLDVLAMTGIRYVIAVNEAGRFAPVVLLDRPELMGLAHAGVTVIG